MVTIRIELVNIWILNLKTRFYFIIFCIDFNLNFGVTGVIFYQNEDGDVLDIQADIIGPCK